MDFISKITYSNKERIERALQKYPALVNIVSDGQTPLIVACMYNHSIVEVLVKYGADVNYVATNVKPYLTPLSCLIRQLRTLPIHSALESIKVLLDAGANVNQMLFARGRSCVNCSPFLLGVLSGCVPLVEMMMKYNPLINIDYCEVGGEYTVLGTAVDQCYHRIVEILLEGGAQITTNAMEIACDRMNVKAFDLMVEHYYRRGLINDKMVSWWIKYYADLPTTPESLRMTYRLITLFPNAANVMVEPGYTAYEWYLHLSRSDDEKLIKLFDLLLLSNKNLK